MKNRFILLVVGALILVLIPAAAFAINPNTTTIPTTSQSLDIEITAPLDAAVVNAGDPLNVTGKVAIGGLTADANVVYVVDVSGSTEFVGGLDCDGSGDTTGDDFNADGFAGSILDCEISGVLALNSGLATIAGIDGGLVPFGSSAVVADVDPAASQQDFTTPLDADKNTNLTDDLEEVARSLDVGSVGLFTASSFSSGTNFNAALTSMNAAFAGEPAGEQNVAFFLSDGQSSLSTGPGTPLQAAIDAGTVVNTYSVGGGATGCAATAGLFVIADSTGGTCTEVSDPSVLSGALTGTAPAGIDRVEIQIDGGAPIAATLDALGNFSAVIPGTSVTGPSHMIEATVFADDPDNTSVTADVTVVTESTATINVVKNVDSDPDGTFDDDAGGWTFQVGQTGNGLIDEAVTGSDGLLTFEVPAGEGYRVRETAGPAGLWQSSATCVDDDTTATLGTGGGLFPPAQGVDNLNLVGNQSITCTFDNQLMAGFMTGGGQIIDDNNGKLRANKLERISFGGNVGVTLAGVLHGQWQANFHNVSDNGLDKGKFHSTSIDRVLFRDIGSLEDPAPPEAPYNFILFDATGRFDGEDGWRVTVQATDTGEPGNGANAGDDKDSIWIQLFDPSGGLVYDSQVDFPPEQGIRHNLDHGNLQIHPAEE